MVDESSGVIDGSRVAVIVGVTVFRPGLGYFEETDAVSVDEIHAELSRRGETLSEWKPVKRYRVNFGYRNSGHTTATDVVISSSAEESGRVLGAMEPGPPATLEPNESRTGFVRFWTSMDAPFPSHLVVRVEAKYRDATGEPHALTFRCIYDRSVGLFQIF